MSEAVGMSAADHAEMIAGIGVKFLRKVEAEREARLGGEIVAADFYLRQITFLEVAFELMALGLGSDGWTALSELRLGEHGVRDIADTPFVRALDGHRRAFWQAAGEPMRPETWSEEFLCDHGACRTATDQHATGALTTPARGFAQEEWAAMNSGAQSAARQAQFDEDAAAQVAWEAAARGEYEAKHRD